MKRNILKIGLFSILAILSADAFASYYETPFEGMETFFPNPATLTLLSKNRLIVSETDLMVHRSFTGTEKTTTTVTHQNLVQQGSATANAPYSITAGHLGIPLPGKRWFFGLSFVSPFNYIWHLNNPTTSIARHAQTLFEFDTYDLTPSIAYKINKMISIGIGFDAVFARATTERYVPLTLVNQALLKNNFTGTGEGWHVGLLFQPRKTTIVGLSYRSQVGINLDGYSKFITPVTTTVVNNTKSSTLLPPITQLTLQQWLKKEWFVTGTIKYTQWNRIQKTVGNNIAPLGSTVVNELHYLNAWDFVLGTDYMFTKKWRMNLTGVYSTTPTQASYRIASTGDTPHYTAILGTRYQVTPSTALYARYGHTWGQSVPVDTYPGALTVDKGRANLRADFVNLEVMFDFC